MCVTISKCDLSGSGFTFSSWQFIAFTVITGVKLHNIHIAANSARHMDKRSCGLCWCLSMVVSCKTVTHCVATLKLYTTRLTLLLLFFYTLHTCFELRIQNVHVIVAFSMHIIHECKMGGIGERGIILEVHVTGKERFKETHSNFIWLCTK